MKRYNAVQGGVYDNSIMIEEDDGDYVWYEDVEQLEALNAELLEALETLETIRLAVPGCICYDQLESERIAWAKSDAAIAKAKGDQP